MKTFMKHHVVTICIVTISIIGTASALGYLSYATDQQLANQATQNAKQLASIDKTIQDLKLKKQAEEKKAAEAAKKAKEAAEKAKQAAANTGANNPSPASPSVGSAAHRDPSRIDVVVNKKHPLQPLRYAPNVTTAACSTSGSAVISVLAVSDFQALCNAAKAAGVPLNTSSSYRSYDTQVYTYNHWVSVNGSQAAADRVSARPGYSEHQTGLAADFSVPNGPSLDNFTGTPQQKWLSVNAWKYGWIQRFTASNSAYTGYDPESWHYRYIGRSTAQTYVSNNGGSLEQFWGIPGGSY